MRVLIDLQPAIRTTDMGIVGLFVRGTDVGLVSHAPSGCGPEKGQMNEHFIGSQEAFPELLESSRTEFRGTTMALLGRWTMRTGHRSDQL